MSFHFSHESIPYCKRHWSYKASKLSDLEHFLRGGNGKILDFIKYIRKQILLKFSQHEVKDLFQPPIYVTTVDNFCLLYPNSSRRRGFG
jgi:hypothetical protein